MPAAIMIKIVIHERRVNLGLMMIVVTLRKKLNPSHQSMKSNPMASLMICRFSEPGRPNICSRSVLLRTNSADRSGVIPFSTRKLVSGVS